MKIGIDYRFAAKTVRGIGVYVKEIVAQLMLLDSENEYILYTDSETNLVLPSNFRIKERNPCNIFWFEHLYLPRMAAKDQLDLIWYPANSGPLYLKSSIKLAVTVHDLIAMMNLNAVKKLSIQAMRYRLGEYYRNFALRAGLRRIDLLLTVSNYSASQINKHLKREAAIVQNNISGFNLSEDRSALQKFGLTGGSYYYSMTGELAHKNLSGLLKVFSDDHLPFKLVVSGVYNQQLIDYLSAEYANRVIFTGYISEAEKICLYKHAAAFLFLPQYEGFGIPLLEAMQFNIPIIASNRASVPEVLGMGGELVDPDNIARIRTLLKELPLLNREKLRAEQELQIRKFSSWESSAEKIRHLFMKYAKTDV